MYQSVRNRTYEGRCKSPNRLPQRLSNDYKLPESPKPKAYFFTKVKVKLVDLLMASKERCHGKGLLALWK